MCFVVQLKASGQACVVVSYYCLTRDVWEPILEPVMDFKSDKAPPVPWFMKMNVSFPLGCRIRG